jgi:hypothetical protein
VTSPWDNKYCGSDNNPLSGCEHKSRACYQAYSTFCATYYPNPGGCYCTDRGPEYYVGTNHYFIADRICEF